MFNGPIPSASTLHIPKPAWTLPEGKYTRLYVYGVIPVWRNIYEWLWVYSKGNKFILGFEYDIEVHFNYYSVYRMTKIQGTNDG